MGFCGRGWKQPCGAETPPNWLGAFCFLALEDERKTAQSSLLFFLDVGHGSDHSMLRADAINFDPALMLTSTTTSLYSRIGRRTCKDEVV